MFLFPESVWTYFDKIGILAGLVSLGVSFCIYLNMKRLIRKTTVQQRHPSPGTKAAVLVMMIGQKDIRGQVTAYLAEQAQSGKGARKNDRNRQKLFADMLQGSAWQHPEKYSADVPAGFTVNMSANQGHILTVQSDDMPVDSDASRNGYIYRFCLLLKNITSMLRNDGVGAIHLFYAGPVVLPMYISDYLSNNMQVFMYQWSLNVKTGIYSYQPMGYINTRVVLRNKTQR